MNEAQVKLTKESLRLVDYLAKALALLPKDEVLVSIEAANTVNTCALKTQGCVELGLMTIEIETACWGGETKLYDVVVGPKLVLR